MDVRNKKVAELQQYKEASTEQKYKDIQALLKMMNQHGKLPKSAQVNPETGDPAKIDNWNNIVRF